MRVSARRAPRHSSRGWPLLSARGLAQRFGILDAVTKKVHLVHEEETPIVTDDDIREGALRQLAQYPEMESALIPMLEDQLEDIEAAIPTAIKSHAELCVLEGKKSQVQLYLKMFKEFIEGE